MRISRLSLTCMAVALGIFGMAAQAADNATHVISVEVKKPSIRQVSNIVYAQKPMRGFPNMALRLDILQPEAKEALPTVLFITGGGFINANKDNYAQQRMMLAEAGYVVASMEYRVAPTVIFPAPLEDVKSALRFLRANAKTYGINPERIAVWGASAGGYLAAFAGTTNGNKIFDQGEHLDQSSEVQATIDFYGLSDLTLVGEGYSPEVIKLHEMSSATEALWVNGAAPFSPSGSIFDHPEKAAAANPINYIDSQTSPFLIMHGDLDTSVSPKQAERLHKALTEKGVESTYYVVEGARHGGAHWAQMEIVEIVIKFLDKHLKK